MILSLSLFSIKPLCIKRVGSKIDPCDPYDAMLLILFTILSFVGFFVLLNVAIFMISTPNALIPYLLYKPEKTLEMIISIFL